MRVSIPKERARGETRVLLLPDGVKSLVQMGATVTVETGVGVGVGIDDDDYAIAGARLANRHDTWESAELVLRYRPPVRSEFQFLRPGLCLAGLLHADGNKALLRALLTTKVTAYSFELFEDRNGDFPLMAATGEISGKLAVIYAAYYLQAQFGGRGVMLPRITGATPTKVVVIGQGNVGASAARTAADLGADVIIFGRNRERLAQFAAAEPRIRCMQNQPDVLEHECLTADVIIGAILVSTYDTPTMLTKSVIAKLRPGTLIIDVTAGWGPGGYLATPKKLTRLTEPFLPCQQALYCRLRTFPRAVPLTSVQAVSALYTPYLQRFIGSLMNPAAPDEISERGRIVTGGKAVHPVIKHCLPFLGLEASA